MITVALAQLRCRAGDLMGNLERMVGLAEAAAARRCAVVAFPEMSDSGYDLEAARRLAAPWDRPPVTLLAEMARRLRLTIAVGLSERDGDRVYNGLAVIGPDGAIIGRYRKVHLFGLDGVDEAGVFTAGDEVGTATVAGLPWGLSVCYDLRFPELYRAQAVAGAQVLLNCAAWPSARIAHWEALARARAIENQAYFVGVNRVGTDTDLAFGGRSLIVSPEGDVVAMGGDAEEELVVGTVDPDRVENFRSRLPALRQRRPDAYRGVGQ